MRKPYTAFMTILVTGMFLAGRANAQQSNTPATPAAKAPAAKTGGAATAPKSTITKTMTLTTAKDKTSYALGMNIGKGLHRDSVDIDPTVFAQGVKDALSGGQTLLTDEEAKAVLTALQADVSKRQQEKMQAMGEANKKEGAAFLEANKSKDGVVALPSGLQYKILKQGNGPKPTASDSVVCNYRGTLINGTEFDSSYKRGQPATFGVGQVIHGWTEALQLMPVGSKWQLFIPSDLGYGPRGAGADIGPNAVLIFEVELLSIQGKK